MGIPLCVHSSFSPLNGLCHPSELCQWAKLNALHTIALTDTNGFYGLHVFLKECKNVGIKPIVGVEVCWESHRIVILCPSKNCYQQTCQLLTKIHFNQLDENDFIGRLIKIGEDGVLFSDDKVLLKKIYPHVSKNQIYYELALGFFNQQDVFWAQRNNLELLASNRLRYIDKSDSAFFKVVRAIKSNDTLSTVEIPYYNEFCHAYSPLEFTRAFSLYPEAIKNTYKVAEMCEMNWNEESIIFPTFDNLNEDECSQLLKKKSYEGLYRRYAFNDETSMRATIERLHYELSVIKMKGFSSYFLVVEDIVKQSPRTCGRGSAASSLVSYLLGITHVDPIKHNLFFDRFLNPEREDMPDIDVDFPWDERDYIFEYVFKKYYKRVAMVANHNTLQGRSSLREVAKVFGIPIDEINYFVKRFPRIEINNTWKNVLFYAQRIQNIFNHLSLHPGGVVITPGPIDCYVPLELTPKGLPVIQWEKRQTKAAKLVKIDLLGNRSLSVVRDSMNMVNKNYGKNYSYEILDPLLDKATGELLKNGSTMGVFYIESPASRLLLQRMKTSEFEHIVMASSIIRPAANKYSIEFVKRLHGKAYQLAHPLLESVLRETYGIMIYQEQVTQTAMALADFSSSDGNKLRKVLDKKDEAQKLEDFKSRFFEGARKKNVPERALEEVWDMILSFSGYSFCKAHSASYAMVSFKSCYFKANYPAEFMASVLSNQGGFYSPYAYLDEARRMNLKILSVDVNESDYLFKGYKDTIRVGFILVKGLTKKCIDTILKQREASHFIDLDDFLERVRPSFEDAKSLVKSRAFSSLRKSDDTICNQMWKVYYHQAKISGENLKIPKVKDYTAEQFVRFELNLLGGGVSFPEWALYRNYLNIEERVKGADLVSYIGSEVLLFGLYVVSKRVRTKEGVSMCFVTFSDETSVFEAVLFPDAYLAYRDILQFQEAFLMKGLVEETLGSIQVNVRQLRMAKSNILEKKKTNQLE